MSIIKNVIYVGIGLAVAFVMFSTVVLPFFSDTWRYCQARQWVITQGGVLTNCSTPYQTTNSTPVDSAGTTHTENGLTSPVVANDCADNDVYCLNCATEGGYRATNQGVTLLVLVLALVGMGWHFFRK